MNLDHSNEVFALKKLFNYLKPDLVIDIGANKGQYLSRLRNDIGYDGWVVCFEPIQEHCNFIKNNFDGKQLIVENLAVGESSGIYVLNKTVNDEFSSLQEPIKDQFGLFDSENLIAQKISVETVTLNDVIMKYSQFQRPFLKMDTQGNDYNIVKGGLSVLKNVVAFQSELSVEPI